jgi:hypothetical protein
MLPWILLGRAATVYATCFVLAAAWELFSEWKEARWPSPPRGFGPVVRPILRTFLIVIALTFFIMWGLKLAG